MPGKDIRDRKRQQKLLKIFLDIVKEELITEGDVKEIIQIGYEIFKHRKGIRNGTIKHECCNKG